jgi:hypothetical protein
MDIQLSYPNNYLENNRFCLILERDLMLKKSMDFLNISPVQYKKTVAELFVEPPVLSPVDKPGPGKINSDSDRVEQVRKK